MYMHVKVLIKRDVTTTMLSFKIQKKLKTRKHVFKIIVVNLCDFSECSEAHPCEGLGEHAHFKDFGMAFLTLFRVATGDNWNGIMKVRE